METKPKKGFYNNERYEKNKADILKKRLEKHPTPLNLLYVGLVYLEYSSLAPSV